MPANAPSLAAGGPATASDAAGGTATEDAHPRVKGAASVPAAVPLAARTVEPEANSVVVLDDASPDPGHASTMALTDEAETVAAHAKNFSSNTKILSV